MISRSDWLRDWQLATRTAVLILALTGTVAYAGSQDPIGEPPGKSAPVPVTMRGRFAGFVATLQLGNEAQTEALVIAPDQRWFAEYARDATTIGVKDLRSGVTLRRLRTGGRKISGLAVSSDSRIVRAVDADGKPLAWTVATGKSVSSEAEAEGINRIDHLTIHRWDNDISEPPGPTANPGPLISRFLASHGLSEQLPDLQTIEQVTTSVDGRYVAITEGYLGHLTIRDLSNSSAPVTIEWPEDWCGHYLSSFAFDGRYVVLGTQGGEGEHAFTDSAAFEIENGKARPLWHGGCSVDRDAPEQISRDARFYAIGAAPNGPIAVWDLKTARRMAHFEGVYVAPIISADGSTLAIIEAASKGPRMLVQRHGKRRHLDVRIDADPTGPIEDGVYALSPSGRYFAARIASAAPGGKKAVGVWDADSARQIRKIEPGGDAASSWKIADLSDSGDIILLADKAVFKAGKWIDATEADESLLRRRSDSQLTSDNKHALIKQDLFLARFTLRQIATGKTIWSLQGTPDLGFVMSFPDGRVRTSPGAEKYLKLVRGFAVKPFDAAAKRQFLRH